MKGEATYNRTGLEGEADVIEIEWKEAHRRATIASHGTRQHEHIEMYACNRRIHLHANRRLRNI